MSTQAQLEIANAPQEMTLEDTHEVRGAGLFADIGGVIDAAIPVIAAVVSKIS
jgi:hypothetical protein